ncbi:MAG: hypothetical protein GX175_05980 [Halanaerobiaceae bacterium]|nr:hypothetical protein [Halanaerobiaceae bacterium]
MKIKFEKDSIKLNSEKGELFGISMTDPLNLEVAGQGIESGIAPKIIKPSDVIKCLSSAGQEESRDKKLEILSSLFDNYI